MIPTEYGLYRHRNRRADEGVGRCWRTHFGPDVVRHWHLRDKLRDGQRFTGQSIELFLVRPAYNCPSEHIEESIAKVQHLPRLRVWRLFWKPADGNWHRYQPCPQADSLADALRVVDEDAKGCFFG